MKLKKLLCLNYSGQELSQQTWSAFDSLVEERVLLSSEDPSLDETISDGDGLLVKLGAKVDEALLAKMPQLKYVGILGTGYGGIDIQAAQKRKITVTNIADYATEAVSEFTFGIILQQLRELDRARAEAKKGNYSEVGYSGSEIKGKVFGVIGLGAIGKRTAQIAQAFGATVIYWSQNRKLDAESQGIQYEELDTVLATSDIITLNVALTPESHGMLTEEKIEKIKSGALFINPSPMELVDISAISKRLQNGEITFVLDHADEMSQEDLALVTPHANCVMYPPIGYVTEQAAQLKQDIIVNNLRGFLDGNLMNVVS